MLKLSKMIASSLLLNKLRQYREFIAFLFGVVLAITTAVFFIVPGIKNILEARRQEAASVASVSKLTAKAAQLASLDESMLKAKVDRAHALVPTKKDIPGIYQNVVSLQDISGVIIDSVTLTPGNISKVSAEKPEELDVALTAKGSFIGLRAFTRNVSHLPRMFVLKSARFSTQDTGGSSAIVSAKTFFLGLPSELSSLEQPVAQLTPEEINALEVSQ